jgi:PST family polysaccharide transporter
LIQAITNHTLLKDLIRPPERLFPISASTNQLEPNRHARLRTDTLAASVVILIVATIIQRSIGFGRGVLFCRWLSPETLGQWEMAYSFLLLFAPLAVLGIPGSYGRYLEHYRQQGQLRTFLRRTTVWTAISSIAAIAILLVFAPQFSKLVFGTDGSVGSIYAIAACLAAVIVHHTLTSLLTAMRLFRVVTIMNFLQSILFAGLTLALLTTHVSVLSIVGGYGIACVVASAWAIWWVAPGMKGEVHSTTHIPHVAFWTRLLRFALFVWITNLLSHLFAVVDRTMIIHCSGLDPAVALEQVGHYHSSRIVPLLLVSFADLLSGLIMPHLSHDWESGRRDEVGRQLNLAVKLSGLGMHAVGVGVLLFSPFMFGVILQGRYNDGLAVLPWTLAGCVISGIYVVAQNYLWCAEHPRLAALPLAIGLLVNVILNLFLIPMWGLHGAVFATGLSTIICLAIILLLSQRHGMKLDTGTWLTCALPITLGIGTTTSAIAFAAVAALAFMTNLVFDHNERVLMTKLLGSYYAKCKAILPRIVPLRGNA